MENKLWYAVMTDKDDTDWGYGSSDLDTALEMAREQRYYCDKDDAYIAVIDDGADPVCVEEIHNIDRESEHKKFCVVWDNAHEACDGIECDTEGEANTIMEEILEGWAESLRYDWEFSADGMPMPTQEQIDEWDYMIDNAYVSTVRWIDDLGEYEDVYFGIGLDDNLLKIIGWMYWEDLEKELKGA